nr:autotransporter outer membrane beta-barrel domain-containing protein [Rickettsia asembonensis]
MSLQNSHSKKYVLTFFMSTCLLTSSFLSTSARAASFKDLVSKTPALSGLNEVQQKRAWESYSLQEKQDNWKKANLVPSTTQATIDVGNGYNERDLPALFTGTRHSARGKKAELDLYIAGTKQGFKEKVDGYISQGKIPTPEEAAQNLEIAYDAKKTDNKLEKNQNVRRVEKDKKALLDLYIHSITTSVKEKEYITTGRVPELDELEKTLKISKEEAKHRRTVIRNQVMEKKKVELITIGKIPTQEELNKLFGKDRESNDAQYINDIRTHAMHNARQQYIDNNNPLPSNDEIRKKFNIKKLEADHFLKQIESERTKGNNNQDNTRSYTKHPRTTTNTGGKSSGSGVPFDTGREERQPYSFDSKSTLESLLKGNRDNYTQSQQNIYKIIQQEENTEEFKNLIKTNPIAALNLEVDGSYKKEAVDAILSDFNDDIIQKILFSDDKGRLDFNTNIDVKNRPTLKQLLDNSSEEQRNKIIDGISTYAKENIIPLVFKGEIRHDKLSDLLKLAVMTDKSIIQELLTLQLELKNDLHSHNVQGTNISPEVIKAINDVLREYNVIEKDLSSSEIVKLANSFNNKGFEDSINIMSSSKEALTTQIYNLFGLSSQNKTHGNAPPPPPPFGNAYLNKLTNTPELYTLYDQFIQNSKVKNENTAKTNQDKTKSNTQERNEPTTEYAKLYKQYRAETGGKKADDLQDQKIKKQADIINVIRQILTESYANQGADEKTLVNLFSIATPEVEEKAKEIFKELVQDPYIQDIIVNRNKTTITRRLILEKIFDEDTDDAVERIILSSCKISEDLKKPIKHELDKLKLIRELESKQDPFEQLKFAYEKAEILGQKFDTRLEELIKNPAILTIAQQITFLTKEDTKLKKVITTDQAQAKLDYLRIAILNAIKLEELTAANLPQNDFMAIVKAKDPALLQEFLKAAVVKQESSNNLDQLRLALPSFSGMSDQQVRALANKLNMSVILKALKDYSQEKAKNHTHTGNVPPPPPGLAYLKDLGFTQDWIDRITKVNEDIKTPIFKTITPKVYNFSSDIALRYNELALSGQKSAGHKAKYSDTDLFKKATIESIVLKHSKHVSKVNQNKEYFEKIQEAVDTMHSNFIGPRTEIGQEIHNIYTSKLLALAKDKDFIKYVEDNIKPSKKRKDELTEAFNTANSDFIGPRTEIGQEVHNIYKSKLSELTKDTDFIKYAEDNIKYQEELRKEFAPEAAPRQQQVTENIQEALTEAFNTANSNFIGPRTEIGQEVHNIYREKLLESVKDKELLLFVEQLLIESTELEQKYGSNVQSEDNNQEKKVGRLDPKQFQSLFQQENEATNDESSTKDDTRPEDSNKKSEKSDSTTALSPRLLSSSDSKNDKSSDDKKSLLALRSSDEDDKGYETDEELEESNNTTEEESKKDIALESEDEAIDVSFKTEAIAEQDEATQRQQVSAETNNKVAVLEVVDRTISVTNKHIYSNIFNNRLDIASIVAAGDEDPTIARGVWISGLYGINKQGTWKNIPKYQGRTTGVTIGADAEFINSHDVIGIAYSRLESQIKYNKKLEKTAVNGHLLSIYGLKELIKDFSLQAITSYGHNYIKNKSKSINNIIGKYQNNNLSFQTLLNYKYRTKYDLHFIPNIGFKYDYSRASNYKEYNVDIENLMIQKKSNQSFESSIGGKIVFKPIATVNNIVLTPSLYGNIERHFNNKNTKVNAKATFKGQTLQETIIIPKQPKLGYNIGSNILMSRKNINVLLEYNYYTHRKYQSHQGLIKLKVNL